MDETENVETENMIKIPRDGIPRSELLKMMKERDADMVVPDEYSVGVRFGDSFFDTWSFKTQEELDNFLSNDSDFVDSCRCGAYRDVLIQHLVNKEVTLYNFKEYEAKFGISNPCCEDEHSSDNQQS